MTPFSHASAGTSASAWRAHPRWSDVSHLELESFARVVVVAAHPDDESLGAAGLAVRAHRTGVRVDLVVVTAGEHSHPASPSVSPSALATRRAAESRAAWTALGAEREPRFLGVEDGTVASYEDAVTTALVDLLGDARDALVVAPWRHDGHPDHEAAGRAAAAACRRTGAGLVEYPIWFWHWGRPADAPWDDLVAVGLDADAGERKAAAIAAHQTQVAPLSPAPGDEALLGPELLEHFAGPVELFVRQATVDQALDRLHLEHDEPWEADHRWYERRKRALTLACLPARRYRNALEVGCSTGVLTTALAERCDAVTALDASPAALARAEGRLHDLAGVRVLQADVPAEWPDGAFDLVVVSEVGYFLSPRDLEALAERVRSSLTPEGCVLLCHWRHEVVGWVLDGPEVHERLAELLALEVSARYLDRDVEILVLSDPRHLPDPHHG